MPLESIFLDFVDAPFFDTHSSKSIRNLNWRLRLTQSFQHDPVLVDLWTQFFVYLSTSGEMTSDNLMAAAQVMFEIEQHNKLKQASKKDLLLANGLNPELETFSESVLDELKQMLAVQGPAPKFSSPYLSDIIWYGEEPPPKTIKFKGINTQVFHPKKGKK